MHVIGIKSGAMAKCFHEPVEKIITNKNRNDRKHKAINNGKYRTDNEIPFECRH
jgi:hypothetical protein